MVRWNLAAAVGAGLVGAAGAVAFPNGGRATADRYDVWMLPPSGAGGESPQLTTGWHSYSLLALDWANTPHSATGVYFRGAFRLANHTKEWSLTGNPIMQQWGPDRCDIGGVWITENGGGLRAIPMYEHMVFFNTSSIPITVADTAYYTEAYVGDMTDDSIGCDFDGTHVHEFHTPDENWDTTPNVTEVRHTDTSLTPPVYPTGGDYLDNYQNNVVYNFTRNFYWDKGS